MTQMTSVLGHGLTACLIGLSLLSSGASAQSTRTHERDHPDVAIDAAGYRAVPRPTWAAATRAGRSGGVSTTPDNQILVELSPDDTTPPHLFDLAGRTLVFMPDGHGGYSRAVQSVAWENDIGPPVADGEEVQFSNFMFDFADHRWSSFFLSRRGLITFGEPLKYSQYPAENRNAPMREVFSKFLTAPTISPLYKPVLNGHHTDVSRAGTQHVSRLRDRITVTWIATDPVRWVHGAPVEPSRFQVVLHADGSIAFNYEDDVFFGDGIVGLFPLREPTKGELLASIPSARDTALPGHLDLLEVAIYEANTGSSTGSLIVEWVTRGPIPVPAPGTRYSYRLELDADEPYFDGRDADEDFTWHVNLESETSRTSGGRGGHRLPTAAANRVALLVEHPAMSREVRRLSASARAHAHEFDNDRHINGDVLPRVLLDFDAITVPDLSVPDRRSQAGQWEVFRHRGAPDFDEVACRVMDRYGDVFDIMVFHYEYIVDSSGAGLRGIWSRNPKPNVGGIGRSYSEGDPLCGSERFKSGFPIWAGSSNFFYTENSGLEPRTIFKNALVTFAHETAHVWAAYASYDGGGEIKPLFHSDCECHWLAELHAPAAFPWDPSSAGPGGFMSALTRDSRSGGFWRENADGTFTNITDYAGGGPSWLDLYMMGLADVGEVPDMFILRNLQPAEGNTHRGTYTGNKEVISIKQIVAAEGPRVPSFAESKKDLNVGFVYLTEPRREPDGYMLGLHATYVDLIQEYWHHVTGGRAHIATTVSSVANRSPMAVGALANQSMQVGGTTVVDVGEAFRDPEQDPLSYEATSSTPAVASVAVSGSTATVRAVAAGTARVTVTATDIGGSNTSATLAFRVTVERVPATTFTDDPILPGVTPIKAVHFTELRERIDLLRDEAGLAPFAWTDPTLTAGVTPVRLSHLLELREALAAAYRAAGRAEPAFTDAVPMLGTTAIRAVHLAELRDAVVALQ